MSLTSRCAQLQDIIKAQGPVSADGYSFMGSNLLKTTILGGTFTPETYQSSVFTTCAPWIIVAALSLAVYLIFLTNAIWLRNCPQKATGLWACCRLPRNRAHTKPLLVIGLFLCTGALAASIAGVIVGGSNKDNGDKAACALIDYLDRVRNGSMSQNWGGTNKSLSTYNKLRDDYTTAITNALALKNSFVTVTTALDAQLLLYQGDLDMLYNARANYKVKSAKAASTATIDPDFITKLGPSTLSGTYLYKLKTESDTLKTTVVDAATYLSNNVKNLDLAGQATVTSGAASFSYFTNALDSVTPLIRNYITENYDRWVNIVNGVSVSLYVCIGLSALIVLAISYHHFYRSQLAIQIAYISWNFLMLWTVVNAVFASQMQVFKKRSLEHCDVFNLVATNKDFVGQLVGFRPVTLTSCMFSTGTTYDTVGITSQVDALGKIAYYIRSVSPYLVTAAGSLEIASQKKVLDNYIQGLLPANSDLTNDDGTSTNMIRFNDYSNSAAAGNLQSKDAQCSISKDTWVLNLTNCGTSLPFSPAYGPADYFGQPICLSILSLDSGSITRRYNDAAFTGCALVGGDKIADILVADYNALNTHFEDTRIKLGQLKRFYDNNLNFKYNQTVISAYSITQPIVDFNSSVSGYLDYIAGATHGVLNNSNCAFFKNDLLSANTFLCNTATGLEKTFITHVVAVACSAMGCIFVYLYLRKLEGTFRLVSNKEDSDLEEIAHSPIPRELQNLDASARGDNDRVLDDAEI